jgi:O-antigen/teichoic acid export membrane protein
MVDNVAVLGLNIMLNLILIPRMGVVGAAIAWSVSLVAVNAAKVIQVRLVVGVRAEGLGLAKIGVASVAAAASAWLLTNWVTTWVQALLIAAPLIGVVYFATTGLLGLEPNDKALVGSLLKRLRRGGRRQRGLAAAQAQHTLD